MPGQASQLDQRQYPEHARHILLPIKLTKGRDVLVPEHEHWHAVPQATTSCNMLALQTYTAS